MGNQHPKLATDASSAFHFRGESDVPASTSGDSEYKVTDLRDVITDLAAANNIKNDYRFYEDCLCPLGYRCSVCSGDVMREPVLFSGIYWSKHCLQGMFQNGTLESEVVRLEQERREAR